MTDKIEEVTSDRGNEYGDFRYQGALAQALKDVVRDHPGWRRLAPYQQEALDMILHKISRIINGNPYNVDSWLDIEGYARITRTRVEDDNKETLNPSKTQDHGDHAAINRMFWRRIGARRHAPIEDPDPEV